MAIISLAEYKTFPAYNSTQADAAISVLIPEVESHFLQIRGAPWLEIIADIESGSAVIKNITDRKYRTFPDISDEFMPGMVAACSGIDGKKILSWDDDDFTLTLDGVSSVTTGNAVITFYPAGAKLIISRMIKYLFENDGESSYRLGDESQQFDGFLGIYPRSIVQGIQRFVKMV